jgi:hypothetical protein
MEDMQMWRGFVWLRMGIKGGNFSFRYDVSNFIKRREI